MVGEIGKGRVDKRKEYKRVETEKRQRIVFYVFIVFCGVSVGRGFDVENVFNKSLR